MASAEALAVKTFFRQLAEAVVPAGRTPTLEEQREGAVAMVEMGSVPEGVSVREAYAGGCRAYWHEPVGAPKDRVILYLHGGGYVIGSPKSHERLVGHLARAAGCRAFNLDYRLAPEHPHPAAVEDATAAYRWLLQQGYRSDNIGISGDSAGGGLTLATLLSIKQNGLPQPAAAAPLSPWTDLEMLGGSMTTQASRDVVVRAEALRPLAAMFLGEHGNARDPLAAPLYGDYLGVAPIYIQVGGDETLLDDSVRLADHARAAGADVKLDVFPEMQHVFQLSVGNMPEATDAVQRLGAWFKLKLHL